MRRVVVTGLGLVTPLACGVEETWSRLLAGKSGAQPITKFKTDDLPTKIACQVPRGDGSDGTFNADQWVDPKEQRRMDDFIIFGLAAAKQAVTDSGWEPKTEEERCRTGVLIGSGIGGLTGIEDASILVHEKGPRRLSPFFIPGRLINLVSGYVSIEHGFKGPNHAVVTACATGAHAIGDAARLIALDDADVMVAGGAEAAICRLGIAGFNACRALSTGFNDTPTKASRPYDKDRDGFVMGEGAGVVMLEELEHAKARGAKIYGEVKGYGLSGDAYHITAPAEDGDGGYPRHADGAEARGHFRRPTSTMSTPMAPRPWPTASKLGAVERVLGNAAPQDAMSSTKSAIGHLSGRGRVGGSDLLPSRHARRHRAAHHQSGKSGRHHRDGPGAAQGARKRDVNVAMSNSFGFGGTNAALIFSKV